MISRIVNFNLFSIFLAIPFLTTFLMFALADIITSWITIPFEISAKMINEFANLLLHIIILFFTYFYAKLCGLYKIFQNYKFWKKLAIFTLMIILVYPVAMFDFKNFKIFENFYNDNNNIIIILVSFNIIFALFLNILFNFLTKKFPTPFEKIGYFFSIEFWKNKIKIKKRPV